jgi:uracil phosphoribosyltransferase
MVAVSVSTHPLVKHKLAQLRDEATPPSLFRALVRDLTRLLFVETTKDLLTESISVQTPLAPAQAVRLTERIALVPILRAGLGMVDPIHTLLPEATVWHLGLYRDHNTLQPVRYYDKLPTQLPIDLAIVLDPMLATGGSAIAAISSLKQCGVKRLKFLGLIAAPEGVEALAHEHPDIAIHIGVIDSHLNDKGYIVPGLGDAGDRQFGTM